MCKLTTTECPRKNAPFRIEELLEKEYFILNSLYFLYFCYLNMKSNCEKASMRTPRNVETAPCMTGANMCSRASLIRVFLSPRLPTKL